MIDPRPDERVETLKQLAARVGLSERQVRHLVDTARSNTLGSDGGFLFLRRVGTFSRSEEGHTMSRRNQGPRLRWLDKRECYYIPGPNGAAAASAALARQTANKLKSASPNSCNTEADEPAQVIPLQILVTDVLNDYLEREGTEGRGARAHRLCGAGADRLLRGQHGRRRDPQTCGRYVEKRGRSPGTVRRELGVLRAAINYAHRSGRITRPVAVELPERPEPRDRWLTRTEAANLIRAARTPQARLYLPLFILIGLYTGRRKEAILSLRWPQVTWRRADRL